MLYPHGGLGFVFTAPQDMTLREWGESQKQVVHRITFCDGEELLLLVLPWRKLCRISKIFGKEELL
jgi:hypothetical protein